MISKRLGLRAKLIAASDTNPLRAHGGPVNEGQTVRLGEVGQLLRTVALSTLVIEARVAILLYPSLRHRRDRPARRPVGGAVLRGDGVHEHRLHARTPGGLAPFADDYLLLTVLMTGVFLGSIGFPVIYTLWKHHGTCDAGRCTPSSRSSRPSLLFFAGRGRVPRSSSTTTRRRSGRWTRGTRRSRRSSSPR